MCVRVLCMCAGTHRGQKRVIDPQELGATDSREPSDVNTEKKLLKAQTFSF